MSPPRSLLARSLRDLTGEYCWGARWDRNTDLWLQFGPAHLWVQGEWWDKRSPGGRYPSSRRAYRLVTPRGAWTFAVLAARWRLMLPDVEPVSYSGPSRVVREWALKRLCGQSLTEASVDPSTGFTRLVFDLGAVLEIRRQSAPWDMEMWLLYRPRGFVLAVRGTGEYHHGRGTSTALPRWRAIPVPDASRGA